MTDISLEEKIDSSRRNNLGRIVMLAACTCGAGLLPAIQQALAADDRDGIRDMSGRVTVGGQAGSIGSKVGVGKTVRVGPDGYAVYVIGGNAFLQRGNTVVTFVRQGLRVLSGSLLSVFAPSKSAVSLYTPTATIGIRGTGVYMDVSREKTYLCLCYGSASVIPRQSPRETFQFSATHHTAYNILAGSPATFGETMLNHTDNELVMLEALQGRKPPFIQS